MGFFRIITFAIAMIVSTMDGSIGETPPIYDDELQIDDDTNEKSVEAVDHFLVCPPRDVARGEGRFVVAIKGNNTFCEGSIIDSNWVLTSARCLSSLVDSNFQVIAGVRSLVRPFEQHTSQIREITNHNYVNIHEGYTHDNPNSEESDKEQNIDPHNIGLIYVKSPFDYDSAVQPIPLPLKECLDDGRGKMYGWQLHKSLKLQTLDLQIIDSDKCKVPWGDDSDIDSHHICTQITGPCTSGPGSDEMMMEGPMDENSNITSYYIDPTCGGNDGSAAVLVTPNVGEVLVGILNYADIDCGESTRPIVYTSTFAYMDWIEKEIKKFSEKSKATAKKRRPLT
ncbi:lectizyme-like [Glossina fuscipes]|uniref:Lectizyme-like n=1 Tax=Glossina fuscipes TaxID=7396 RepID=A0A8U0WG80_9MUSC|nr:lectizyme-like [Glossina fuscipes]